MTARIFGTGAFAALVLGAALLASGSLAQDKGVVARVDGRAITEEDVAVAMEMYAQQLGDMPDDAKRSMLVDALIEARLVADAARKAGVADQEDYKRRLAFFETETLRAVYLDKRAAEKIDEAAVRKAYDDQVAKTPGVAEFRLSHILLPTQAAADETIAALKAGKDFAELARERSTDPASKDKGGDLGFVVAGQTLPEIDAAVALLQPGQYAEAPVKSPFGFHIVKLTERRDRPPPDFQALAPQIRQALEAEEEKRVVDELRNAARIEKLVPDVAPPAGGGDGDGH